MQIFTFIVSVVMITASGALAPGPLLFANIAYAAKSGAKGGLAFSLGHTLFEFVLVSLLASSIQIVVDHPLIELVIGVVGGTGLIFFGFLQMYKVLTLKSDFSKREKPSARNPLLLGVLFTGFNPYFITWWFTAGMPLIENALALASFVGVLVMLVSHVWMDYVWLIGTAYLAKKGTSLTGKKTYKIMMVICGLILVSFGVYFIKPLVSWQY